MLSKRLLKRAVDDETMKKEFIDKIKNRKITEQEIGEFPLLDNKLIDLILDNIKKYNLIAIFEGLCNNPFILLENDGSVLEYFMDRTFYVTDQLAEDIYDLPNRLDYFEYRFDILFRNRRRREDIIRVIDNIPEHHYSLILKEITKKHFNRQRIIKNPALLSFIKEMYSYDNTYQRVFDAASHNLYDQEYIGAFYGLDEKLLEEVEKGGVPKHFKIFKGMCRNVIFKKQKPHLFKKFIEEHSAELSTAIAKYCYFDELMFCLKNIFKFSPESMHLFLKPGKETIYEVKRELSLNDNPTGDDKEFHDFLKKWLEDSEATQSLSYRLLTLE